MKNIKHPNFFDEISRLLENICQFQEREKIIVNELLKPAKQFEQLGVKDTIVFFGSAIQINQKELEKVKTRRNKGLELTQKEIKLFKMSHYYKQAEKLAEKLTKWSKKNFENSNHCVICSGGGYGIMEAANKGAKAAGGNSIGLNIQIPYEQIPNKYQSDELKFMFHYFFMRKFWFSYLAKAVVVFPGGFGTLDELFEIYTLIKTKKTHDKLPVILFGKEFWEDIINFNEMIDWGTIPEEFQNIVNIKDDVDDVFEILISQMHVSKED